LWAKLIDYMCTFSGEVKIPRYAIGKVRISAVTMDETLRLLERQVQCNKSTYICAPNVRVTIIAQKDERLCQIENKSFLSIPDGMPLVWYAKLAGIRNIGKVSGPDLMMRVLSISNKQGYSHYFYGSTKTILESMRKKLTENFGDLDIRAMVSPPFRALTDEEKDAIAEEINCLKPTFVWVGLGAPKQEFWMADMIERIDSSILVGVGAAFSFSAGKVRRPPEWVSSIGLEWLYRCLQQPITSRRFIKPFFKFSYMLAVQALCCCLKSKARFWEGKRTCQGEVK